jgi:hypothetical protein
MSATLPYVLIHLCSGGVYELGQDAGYVHYKRNTNCFAHSLHLSRQTYGVM